MVIGYFFQPMEVQVSDYGFAFPGPLPLSIPSPMTPSTPHLISSFQTQKWMCSIRKTSKLWTVVVPPGRG